MESVWAPIWDWGITFIEGLQKITCKPLDWLAYLFHYAFNMPIYLLLMLVFCWCIDMRKGMKLGTTVLLSCSINTAVKGVLKVQRPFQYTGTEALGYKDSPVFRVLEDGYSTPSGHSQTAATFWPIAAWFIKPKEGASKARRNWTIVGKVLLAVLLPILIGLSRNYLGVHYPTDVMLGLIIGFLFAGAAILWGGKIEALFSKLNKIYQILILAVITVILNFLSPEDTSMPGAFFGFTVGYVLLGKRFDAKEGKWWHKILRLVVGGIMVGIVYLGLKKIFPGRDAPWGQFCRFIRYGICGIMITFVEPVIFVLLKIAKKEE